MSYVVFPDSRCRQDGCRYRSLVSPLPDAARERALACAPYNFAFFQFLLHAAGALEMKLPKGYSAVPAGVLPVRLDLPERQVHGDGNAHKKETPRPPQGARCLCGRTNSRFSPGEELLVDHNAASPSTSLHRILNQVEYDTVIERGTKF